jgi:uncharacterized membrane protein YsdA (DUF1294 family)
MDGIWKLVIGYLFVINVVALWAMSSDKRRAIQRQRRWPEIRLFTLALVGGAAGMWLGMYLFRHKTKHMKFVILIPLILLLQAAAVILLIRM